eukprot:318271-Rhodomonas_salina.2
MFGLSAPGAELQWIRSLAYAHVWGRRNTEAVASTPLRRVAESVLGTGVRAEFCAFHSPRIGVAAGVLNLIRQTLAQRRATADKMTEAKI